MEKQLTALAQSIARKKDRVVGIKLQMEKLHSNQQNQYPELEREYYVLLECLYLEIREDEKLLAVEMDDIIRSYRAGEEGLHLFAGTYFNNTFKND